MAGLVQKIKDMWNSPEEDYDYEYEDEAMENPDLLNDNRDYDFDHPREKVRRSSQSDKENSSKVVNIHATAKLQVVLFKPERFGEETRAVADELLKMHTIVLNLENSNNDVSRRIIDFLSGVAYANGGKIKRVATGTFVITPYNVDLTGDDVLDELENNGVYF